MPLTDWQRQRLDAKGVDWGRVSYVEPDETLDALADGQALLVDVRRGDAYASRHFPGAISWRRNAADQPPPRGLHLYVYCT